MIYASKFSNCNQSQISFGSNQRCVYNKSGKLAYKNRTDFFRNDLDWNKFVYFLDTKYKKAQEVNIFNAACSDGSETFSLAAILLAKLKSAADKFFPINASDADKVIIHQAENRPCDISDVDLRRINQHTESQAFKYFRFTQPIDTSYPMAVKPKDDLKSKINFEQADIIEVLKKLPEKNNVIICRNFWKYLTSEKIAEMIELFKQKLDETSSVVIGELERGWNYNELLEQNGFKETKIINVFEKIKI